MIKQVRKRKRYLATLVPLLAVVAFVVAPAVAQAQPTREYGTAPGGVFKAFAVPTNVESKGTAPFKLATATADIECKKLADSGTVENINGVGHSKLTLTFSECVGSGAIVGCIPNGTGIIEGEVTDEVLATGTEVEVVITNGFEVVCGGVNLGKVTGKATGTQPAGSNVLTFTNAPGLLFAGEPATITGSDEINTSARPKEPVVIN